MLAEHYKTYIFMNNTQDSFNVRVVKIVDSLKSLSRSYNAGKSAETFSKLKNCFLYCIV